MKNYKEYLSSSAWKAKREWALERAGRHCCLCCSTQQLDVHHNNYQSVGTELPTDLVVLCRACHGRHHDALPKIEQRKDDRASRVRILKLQGLSNVEISREAGLSIFTVVKLLQDLAAEDFN